MLKTSFHLPAPVLRYATRDWESVSGFYRFLYRFARDPIRVLAPVHARGAENLPREGGVIVAPAHQTFADPVVVAAVLPRPSFFLAKAELFKNELFDRFFRANGCVPVYRGAREGNPEAYRFAAERLAQGASVMVYPEATRGRPGEMLPFKTGVVRLALTTGAPIVPVGIEGFRFWPLEKRIPRFGRGFYVSVGEPWHLPKDGDLAIDADAPRKLTLELESKVARLVDECRNAQARGDAWPW